MIHVEETTFHAKTIDDCLAQAEKSFGVSKENLKYEVVQEPREGFLGIGKKDAILKVLAGDYDNGKSDTEEVEKQAEAAPVEKTETFAEPEKMVAETPDVTAADEAENKSDVDVAEDDSAAKPAVITEIPDAVYEAKDYIINVLSHLGVIDVTVDIEPMEGGVTFIIDSNAENKGNIIGRRGETLDALQYLASVIVNRHMEDYFRINIDSNGYRDKRKSALEGYAWKMGKRVARHNLKKKLEPMNPYERRIIHSVIAQIDDVTSYSIGVEPYRRVVIVSDYFGKQKPRKPRKPNPNGNTKYNNNRKRNGGRRYKSDENYVPKPKSMDSMKTSFEKEYSKPKPEDNIEGGLYGKIEL